MAAIEAARAKIAEGRHVIPEVAPEPKHEIVRGAPAEEAVPSSSQPYVKARLTPAASLTELHQEKPEQLARMIQSVVEVEAPVHTSEVTRRLMEVFGVTRAGTRITTAIENAIHLGVRQRLFHGRGDFVYSLENRPIPIRSRANREPAERKFEWIAPEELDQALVETVTLGFSMSCEDAISGAVGLLGFGRATSKISAALEDRIDSLAAEGRLQVVGGVVTTAGG